MAVSTMMAINLSKTRLDKIVSTRENFETAMRVYEKKSADLRNVRTFGTSAVIDTATRELISAGDQLIAWAKLYADATENLVAVEMAA
jgi:hypothetical protein